MFRDKEVLTTERALEKQKMEENLVENKMNVILDSGLFSKVTTIMMTSMKTYLPTPSTKYRPVYLTFLTIWVLVVFFL